MKDAVRSWAAASWRASRGDCFYNLGASGDLQKQIEAGAPVDVFLSAAQRQMDELEKQKLIVPGQPAGLRAQRCSW